MSVPLLHRPEPDDPLVGLCGEGGYTRVKATFKQGRLVSLEPAEWVLCGKCEDLAHQFGFGAAPIFDAAAAKLLAAQKFQEEKRKP